MFGPKPFGYWSARVSEPRGALQLGQRYRVIREFFDYDRVLHPVGETWRFVGSGFLPYDNGLSLFVQTVDGEWHIRLQLDVEEQGPIWADFVSYVEVAAG